MTVKLNLLSLIDCLRRRRGERDADYGFRTGSASATATPALLAGNRKLAADYFQQSLSVVVPMLSVKHTDLGALYAAADAYAGLGELRRSSASPPGLTVEDRKANCTEAISWYRKSLDTWKRVDHPSHSAPNDLDASDPAVITRNLETCQATVAHLSHAAQVSHK